MPKREDSNETYLFLNPKEPDDETQHTLIQKRILQELMVLQNLNQLDPQDSQDSRDQLLSNSD